MRGRGAGARSEEESHGKCSVKVLYLGQHAAHMSVALARFKHPVTLPRITPMKDLDGDTPNAPVVHLVSVGTIEIDRVTAGQRPPVVVNLIGLAGGQNHELGSRGPARPIGRRAADGGCLERRCQWKRSACLQWRSDRVEIRVGYMVAFGMSIRGSPDLHELASLQGRLVRRELSFRAPDKEESRSGESSEGDHSKLHVRGG
jgi:hypothetical protein